MTIYSSWRAVEFPKRRSNLKIWNTAQSVQVQENFETNTREIVLEHFEVFGLSGRLSRLTWTNFLLRIPFSRIHHGGKNAHRRSMSQNATRWTVRAHTIEGRLGVTRSLFLFRILWPGVLVHYPGCSFIFFGIFCSPTLPYNLLKQS